MRYGSPAPIRVFIAFRDTADRKRDEKKSRGSWALATHEKAIGNGR